LNLKYPFINLPDTKEKLWLTWISTSPQLNEGLTILIDNLQGYCSVYNQVGTFIGNLELNESLKIENSITLMDILSSTGLQIKADPGILLIYLGFLFLMIS
jgi:cytochrome c biogenesis protein